MQPTPQANALSRSRTLNPVERLTAERMMQSHLNTAHVTILGDADATALARQLEQMKAAAAADDVKPTYTPLLVKIIALALRRHPEVNVRLEGNELQYLESINVGVALSGPQGQLFVPVVRNADSLSIPEIARQAHAFRERAQAKRLTPADMQGGTFTLTNLGMFSAISHTTPLINPPQCAIFGVGAIRDVLQLQDERLITRKLMGISLTHDHRILNGYPAGAFFQSVAELIADPRSLT